MSNFDNFQDNNAVQEMGWDQPITAEAEKEFILLEPGTYNFMISGVEKSRYEPTPNSKMPACPKVKLSLDIMNEGAFVQRLSYNLFYYEKGKWRIDDVFIGTGKATEGQSYIPNPDMLLGATGTCEIEQVPGYNDPSKVFNNVKKVLRKSNFGGF